MTKIKIGPYKFKLESDRDKFFADRTEDGVDYFGFTDEATQTIYIDADQSSGMYADTLIHEILHVIFMAVGAREVENLGDKEEYIISAITPMLIDTIRRNPYVIDTVLGV